jgi:hypothetical protein
MQEQAPVPYEIVETVMASDVNVSGAAAARWRVVQQEVAAAVKGAAGPASRKSS